jgi:hypothetical protein
LGDNFVGAYSTTVTSLNPGDAGVCQYTDVSFDALEPQDGWTFIPGGTTFTCNQAGKYLVIYRFLVGALAFTSATDNSIMVAGRAVVNGIEVPGSIVKIMSGTALTVPPLPSPYLSALSINDISASFIYTFDAADILTIQVVSDVTSTVGTASLDTNTANPNCPNLTGTSASIAIVRIE